MTVTTTATTSAHQNHHTPSYVHSHSHTHLHSHTSGNGNINPASPSKRHHLVFDRQLLAQATAAAAKNGNVGAGSPLWSLARHLQLRLQYARLKVDHGWQKQTIAEVENLYFHQRYAPAGTESVSDQGPGVGVFSMGVGRTIASANLAQRIAAVTGGGGEAEGLTRIVPAPTQGIENGSSATGWSIQHESGDGGAESSNSRPPQTPPTRPVDGEDGDENGEQEESLAGTDVQTPATTSTTTLANSNPTTTPTTTRTHLLPSIFPPSASTSASSATPRPTTQTNVLPTTHRARTPQNPTTTSTSTGTATTATSLGRATSNTPLSYDSFWSTHTSAATTLRNRR